MKLKKYCPDYQNEQHFFKYFKMLPAVFEKMSITNNVCLLLGADELTADAFQEDNKQSRY